jgi:hypothetical protein
LIALAPLCTRAGTIYSGTGGIGINRLDLYESNVQLKLAARQRSGSKPPTRDATLR